MAKKKSKTNVQSESSVAPIVEIAYSDPLFSLAAHPTKPLLLSGLATGHLFCHTYDADKLEEEAQKAREARAEAQGDKVITVSQGKPWWTVVDDHANITNPHISTAWKTKRHKGSCRSVIFDPLELSVGESLYSVGTDYIIKKANTETGKVISKTLTQAHLSNKDNITKLCHSATHKFLLSGTENGHVLVYDSANLSAELKFKVNEAHEDAINDILPMANVSPYHYLTLGSTTLSHIDVRKGIITQSDDQADELLLMCYPTDHVNDHKNDTVLVGHGEGIVTIWKNSKNKFMDQLSRIKVNKNASIDVLMPTMNNESEELTNSVWCGDSDGLLHRIDYKRGRVVETRVHSRTTGKHGAIDEVGILDIDYDYRLISAGMDSVKIWSKGSEDWEDVSEGESVNDESDESDDGSDLDSDLGSLVSGSGLESDSNDDNVSDNENDSDPESDAQSTKPNILRTKSRFPAAKLNSAIASEPEKPTKKTKMQPKLKSVRLQEPGIKKFEGL